MSLLTLLKGPLKAAGRLGQATEFGFSSVFHPEQILSKSPRLKKLYNVTVKEERISNLAKEHYKNEVAQIIKKYDLTTQEKVNEFLGLLEYPNFHGGKPPSPQEIASFSKNAQLAAVEHLEKVTDPIWEIAKKFDPSINYQPGYFTHFPILSKRRHLEDEAKRLSKLIEDTPDLPEVAAVKSGWQQQLSDLTSQLRKVHNTDNQVNALRYRNLPGGGKYGPLNESREAPKWLGYKMDYQDVMDEYIDGAFRKIFLDRYMPVAKKLVDSEPNAALRQYAFDYVTAQRGALASKRKLFWNEALSRVFPDPESGYTEVSKTVDYLTRFQYLSKIGTSWFRFPFINMTQPFLTTYPMVGGKIFSRASLDALTNPGIWREAKNVGVIFEADLRKGLIEALGRGGKIGKAERLISYPATLSEKFNRVLTYSAGKMQALKNGMKEEDAIESALRLVNRTQFLYTKAGMPLIMSSSPAGRLLFQFRTFTANYVNFLTQLVREKNWNGLARAIGSLGLLAGSSAIPFKAWDTVRGQLIKKAGVDIGEGNPIQYVSEELLGLSPGVNFGGSLEPFNIPSEAEQLFGPTVGPILGMIFDIYKDPEKAGEVVERFFTGQVPPLRALTRGIVGREMRSEPTQLFPKGRVLGQRSTAEMLYLRPSLESIRYRYIKLISQALAGGHHQLAKKFIDRGRQLGLRLDEIDLKEARRKATISKGLKSPTSPEVVAPSETTQFKRPVIGMIGGNR